MNRTTLTEHREVRSPEMAELRTDEYRARVRRRNEDLERWLSGLIPPKASLIWEVGCGHGHFLTAYAAAHRDQLCVGVDIVRDRIERATKKARRGQLSHLHFLLADAHEFLSLLPAGASLSSVYVLFPDPWPKRRHHKNRIIQPEFLNAVAERGGEQTRLYFRTDFEPYFTEVSAMLRAHEHWECVDEPFPFETQTVFQARAATYFSLVARSKSPPPKA